jgi:hypothetical protein
MPLRPVSRPWPLLFSSSKFSYVLPLHTSF